jgi:hypothetical protein
MRKRHNSLKSGRKRKTLRDTSLSCDTNKFGSKKKRLCLKCEEYPLRLPALSSLLILISIAYLYGLVALLKSLILQYKTAKYGQELL